MSRTAGRQPHAAAAATASPWRSGMIAGILEILIGFLGGTMTTACGPELHRTGKLRQPGPELAGTWGRRPRIVADPPLVVPADDLVPADADPAHLQSRG